MSSPVKSYSSTLLLNISLLMVFSTGLLGALWIAQEFSVFKRQAEQMRVTELDKSKERMKAQVEDVTDFILFKRSQVEERIQEKIKNRVYEAHAIASHIYLTYRNEKSLDQLKKMVKEALRPIRFNQERGYIFMTSMAGEEQLFVDKPEHDGVDFLNMQDSQGAFVVQDMITLVREKGEGFHRYSWTKPHSQGNDFQKISFVKHFAPFDWYIGTGFYLDDMEELVKAEVVERIRTLPVNKSTYVFAGQWDGLSLAGPKAGESLLSGSDRDAASVVRKLVEKSKAGGGFVDYVMPDFDSAA